METKAKLTANASVSPVDMMSGITRKTLNYGDKTMLVELKLPEGSVLPAHTHPHEQIGYLVKGKVLFEMNGETKELTPGDSWIVPGSVEHKVTALLDSIAVDIFSPVREEYK